MPTIVRFHQIGGPQNLTNAYPTNFLKRVQMPAGSEVTKSYGEVGQIPHALFKPIMSKFEGKDAPNPHAVAETIAQVVGQSKGSRATRTAIGASFGSDKANEDVALVQAKVVQHLSLSNLETIA